MKVVSETTILITGATDGLGKMTAERFAQKGAKVLLHGRNEEKGRKVLEEIKESTGNQKLEYFNGDFSSLASVDQLAEKLNSFDKKLDILINNAGIGGGPKSQKERETTQDGYELRWSVNYLSQVLLTRKLSPIMNNGARIINVASTAQSELDFDDLNLEKNYDGYSAYARSKAALIMFTFVLASELGEKGINVNAIHPSTLMETNMAIDHFGGVQSTVEEGVEAVEFLATSESLEEVSGEYFKGKTSTKALSQAYNKDVRETLKKATEDSLTPYI